MNRTTRQITRAEIEAERERAAKAYAERQANPKPDGPLVSARLRLRSELGREPTRAEVIAALSLPGVS